MLFRSFLSFLTSPNWMFFCLARIETLPLNIEGKFDEGELRSIVKQHPNRLLFKKVRFHLGVYNAVDKDKMMAKVESKKERVRIKNEKRKVEGRREKEYHRTIREWLVEDVGEEPVIYDALLKNKSTRQIELYLQNKGYFNAKVSDSVSVLNKRADVTYFIETNTPYTIRKIKFSISDTALVTSIKNASKKTLLKPGTPCDVDIIAAERSRIENVMKDQGYYRFSREYVYFEIDSNLNKNKIDIKQIVKNPKEYVDESIDSLRETTHKVYYIGDVYVNTNYNPRNLNIALDTVLYKGIYFLTDFDENFKKDLIASNIFINSGELYAQKRVKYTNDRISALRNFRFVNISFQEVSGKKENPVIDCFINLVPVAKHSIVSELETTTNRMAPLGISGGVFYRNKNTFRGAELFELNFSGGIEAQRQLTENISEFSSRFFNTLEFGPSVSLNIPRLLIPNFVSNNPAYINPYTNFSVAYHFQTRLDYTRNIAALNISYSWKPKASVNKKISRYLLYRFQPLDVNLVRIDKTSSFERQLEATNNRFLILTYQNHLISSSNFTIIFDNNEVNKKYRNTEYLKFNIEGAGNTLRAAHNIVNKELNSEGGYELFGIQFAQYVKPEIDVRLYRHFNKHSKMAYRLFAGVGVPLNNLDVLPFEKSYFAGGANGIRAWTARTLGPGSLADTSSTAVDRIGDIQLEGNAEYRFDIIDVLQGAAFVDFGNIWLRNFDAQRIGGQFRWDDFYKSTAIGLGLGARFDFSFLILRLDFAIPIRDPSLTEGERWIYQSKDKTNEGRRLYYGNNYSPHKSKLNLNFGIGYPF